MLKFILLETLVFEDDSGLKTIRPSDKNVLEVKSGSRSQNRVIELSDSESEKTYVTPLLLKHKKRKVAPPPKDAEPEEHSEIEQKLTRKKAQKSSTDKVR